jgi:hypothetical protein
VTIGAPGEFITAPRPRWPAERDFDQVVPERRDLRGLGAVGGDHAASVAGDEQPAEPAIGVAEGEEQPVLRLHPVDPADEAERRGARRSAFDPALGLLDRPFRVLSAGGGRLVGDLRLAGGEEEEHGSRHKPAPPWKGGDGGGSRAASGSV